MGKAPPEGISRRTALHAGAGIAGLACLTGEARAEPGPALSPPNAAAFMVPAGATRKGEHFKMKGVTSNTLDVKLSGTDTDGRLAVIEQIGQSPNGGPPLHLHPDQDEVFHGVEGRYRFEVGGEQFELGPGDVIFAPRGVPHAFIQLTEVARMMLVYQPAGLIEEFFRTTAGWTAPPTQDEVVRVFAAHGMKVVGPPMKPI